VKEGERKGRWRGFWIKKQVLLLCLTKNLSLSLSLGDYTKTKILLSILVKTENFPILFGIVSFILSL
jgi:hypothetical protein